MEVAITALACVALIVFGALTIAGSALSTTGDVGMAWKTMERIDGDLYRTELGGTSGSCTASAFVDVVCLNEGETRLEDFERWDVILRYWEDSGTPGYQVTYLAYDSGTLSALDDNEWIVEGIYRDAGAATVETYDPGILNPDEYIRVRMKLNPTLSASLPHTAWVCPANGGSPAAVSFTGP